MKLRRNCHRKVSLDFIADPYRYEQNEINATQHALQRDSSPNRLLHYQEFGHFRHQELEIFFPLNHFILFARVQPWMFERLFRCFACAESSKLSTMQTSDMAFPCIASSERDRNTLPPITLFCCGIRLKLKFVDVSLFCKLTIKGIGRYFNILDSIKKLQNTVQIFGLSENYCICENLLYNLQ